MPKKSKDPIERIVIKIPKSVADYFRETFPHGKRSEFVAQCILKYKNDQEVKALESQLKKVGSRRQS